VAESLPEPEASLLLGLVIGDRGGIPNDVADDFRSAGVSHVLAVSGYNVAKIADAALMFFALVGLRRRRALIATAAALILFAEIAGLGSPVIRATVMGGLSLAAGLLRRRSDPNNALALAAALMLADEPSLLRHDVSFALSFAAVWGLAALGRPLEKELGAVPEFGGLRKILAETLGATLATLPFTLLTFGRLPLLAPFANAAILPFVPAAMAFGFAVIILGSLHPILAFPAAFAAMAPLRWMLSAAAAFAALPWNIPLPVGPAVAALLCLWIILLAYALNRRTDRENL
ncbi:MAG: ComEC/Rec2 family competence protein, partial [Patescibacteria group bacterium]